MEVDTVGRYAPKVARLPANEKMCFFLHGG